MLCELRSPVSMQDFTLLTFASELYHQHDAIAHRQENVLHPSVVANAFVQRVDRLTAGIGWMHDLTASQHVVQDDHTLGPNQLHCGVEIFTVTVLVGIDETKIERSRNHLQ